MKYLRNFRLSKHFFSNNSRVTGFPGLKFETHEEALVKNILAKSGFFWAYGASDLPV